MLNEKKIILMTKLAKYEQEEGKKDIRLSKYYKADYIRYNTLKAVLGMSVAYIMIIIMLIFYKSEYLIENVITLDYVKMGKSVIGVYILLLILYTCVSAIIYSVRFNLSRKQLGGYARNLKLLRKFYKEEADNKQGGI